MTRSPKTAMARSESVLMQFGEGPHVDLCCLFAFNSTGSSIVHSHSMIVILEKCKFFKSKKGIGSETRRGFASIRIHFDKPFLVSKYSLWGLSFLNSNESIWLEMLEKYESIRQNGFVKVMNGSVLTKSFITIMFDRSQFEMNAIQTKCSLCY